MKLTPPILAPSLAIAFLAFPPNTEADLKTELEAPPITNALAPYHDIFVTWVSSVGIDTDTLGNDDLILGRGSLFDFQLGSGAFHPSLVATKEEDGNKRIRTTYRIERPADGWDSWSIRRLRVGIDNSSVLTTKGHGLASCGIGALVVDLDTVPTMTFNLVGSPNFLETAPEFTFEVRFETNYSLDLSLFGSGEIRLFAIGPRLPDGGTSPWVLPEFSPEVDAITSNDDNTEVTVRYVAQRPEDGWATAERVDMTLQRSKMGANDRSTINPAAGHPIGWALIVRERQVIATIDSDSAANVDDEVISFDVTYESTGEPIDQTSLDNEDVGPARLPFGTGVIAFAEFVEVVSAEEDGRRVTATYKLNRPDGGWIEYGWRGSLPLAVEPGAVRSADGGLLTAGAKGILKLEDPGNRALPQLVALDDWFRDLGDVLGEAETIEDVDRDGDGAEDVLEFMTGSDPLDPTSTATLVPEVLIRDGQPVMQLRYQDRLNVRDAAIVLEGSATGEEWISIHRYFEPVIPMEVNADGLSEIVLQSKMSLDQLPLALFRLRVLSIAAESQ